MIIIIHNMEIIILNQEMRRLRAARKTKKEPPNPHGFGGPEKETGGALLSRAPGRSTIAAGALNGRVREGNGC